MKTVTLDVRAPEDSMADFVRVWKTGKAEKSAHTETPGGTSRMPARTAISCRLGVASRTAPRYQRW